jgi:membrane-bound lytic murein transglycosylase D
MEPNFLMRYLCVMCVVLFCSCATKQADPPKQLERAHPVQVQDGVDPGTFDSLRAEVRLLSAIVRRLSIVDIPETVYFCGIRVPMERWWVRKKVSEYLTFYTNYASGRRRMELYIREAPYYFPYIEARLRERALPEDLKYVPVVESELNPVAESPKNAVGMWQIMASTGRERSMRMTRYIDERRDFERATEAALQKLEHDRVELGNDWFLSLAAYNAGLSRIKRAVSEHGDRSYFNMILPSETMAYGFRLIAVKMIMEHPLQYGFTAKLDDSQPIEVVNYTVPKQTTLIELGRQLNLPPRELQLLNPQFVSVNVPPGTYRLKLPSKALLLNGKSEPQPRKPNPNQ